MNRERSFPFSLSLFVVASASAAPARTRPRRPSPRPPDPRADLRLARLCGRALRPGPLDEGRRDLHDARAERRGRRAAGTSSSTTPPTDGRTSSFRRPSSSRPAPPSPLAIESYAWSPDGRSPDRVHQLASASGARTPAATSGPRPGLGPSPQTGPGRFEPSTLMFAKLSPDGAPGRLRRARTTSTSRIWPRDASRRLTFDGGRRHHQRHVRLGLRGGVRPARRLPLEPGRRGHRLLAVRHDAASGFT